MNTMEHTGTSQGPIASNAPWRMDVRPRDGCRATLPPVRRDDVPPMRAYRFACKRHPAVAHTMNASLRTVDVFMGAMLSGLSAVGAAAAVGMATMEAPRVEVVSIAPATVTPKREAVSATVVRLPRVVVTASGAAGAGPISMVTGTAPTAH